MSSVPQSDLTVYRQKAVNTRLRRRSNGKYPTPAQKAAWQRRLAVGSAELTQAELAALATYPHLLPRQRAEYAARAAQAVNAA